MIVVKALKRRCQLVAKIVYTFSLSLFWYIDGFFRADDVSSTKFDLEKIAISR